MGAAFFEQIEGNDLAAQRRRPP